MVIERLEQNGWEAYAVGGCVRDSLRGVSPADWDITTSATPQQIADALDGAATIIPTGVKHGTVTAVIGSFVTEITTFRRDGAYTDHRHPDTVRYTRSLREDLARRDFTVNAMAYHPQKGLFDPFDGQSDLRNGILRCVGEATIRLQEDALRILRGVRFASTLGLTVEPATAEAIHRTAPLLRQIAAERVTTELVKWIIGAGVEQTCVDFADVLAVVLGESADFSVKINTLPSSAPARLAALYAKAETADVAALTERLRLDKATADTVILLHRYLPHLWSKSRGDLKRFLGQQGEEITRLLLSMQAAMYGVPDLNTTVSEWLKAGVCYSLRDLAINGETLIEHGFVPDPTLGKALEYLLTEVTEGRCDNTADALLALAEQMKSGAVPLM